jgi:hypothetical protein
MGKIIMVQSQPWAKSADFTGEITKKKRRAGGVVQTVEHLSSKWRP